MEDGPECSGVQFTMFRNGQDLLAGGSHSAELHMASALGMDDKTETAENRNDLIARETLQLRHEAVQAPS